MGIGAACDSPEFLLQFITIHRARTAELCLLPWKGRLWSQWWGHWMFSWVSTTASEGKTGATGGHTWKGHSVKRSHGPCQEGEKWDRRDALPLSVDLWSPTKWMTVGLEGTESPEIKATSHFSWWAAAWSFLGGTDDSNLQTHKAHDTLHLDLCPWTVLSESSTSNLNPRV